jgi:hypothetical protein
MWNVIEKCDFRFFLLQKVFLWIRSRDHAWSSHRLCFDCLTRTFSRWRTRSNSIFRNDRDLNEATHQIRRKRFIKFDESDSSNLIRAISSNLIKRLLIKSDRRHLVKRDELYLIKSDERHLIKLWKKKTIFLLSDKRSPASTRDIKNLVWRKITFVRR